MSKHTKLEKAVKLLGQLADDERWHLKQLLAAPGRFYGDGGTIHSTDMLDVCVDDDGDVTNVWFRCQELPFRQCISNSPFRYSGVSLSGVEVCDLDRQ